MKKFTLLFAAAIIALSGSAQTFKTSAQVRINNLKNFDAPVVVNKNVSAMTKIATMPTLAKKINAKVAATKKAESELNFIEAFDDSNVFTSFTFTSSHMDESVFAVDGDKIYVYVYNGFIEGTFTGETAEDGAEIVAFDNLQVISDDEDGGSYVFVATSFNQNNWEMDLNQDADAKVTGYYYGEDSGVFIINEDENDENAMFGVFYVLENGSVYDLMGSSYYWKNVYPKGDIDDYMFAANIHRDAKYRDENNQIQTRSYDYEGVYVPFQTSGATPETYYMVYGLTSLFPTKWTRISNVTNEGAVIPSFQQLMSGYFDVDDDGTYHPIDFMTINFNKEGNYRVGNSWYKLELVAGSDEEGNMTLENAEGTVMLVYGSSPEDDEHEYDEATGTYKDGYPGYSGAYARFDGLKIAFTDEPATGIANIVKEVKASANTPMYNIAGQQVNKNYKGIVIKDGKKFVNK